MKKRNIMLAMCDLHLADIYRERLEADGWRVDLAEHTADIERTLQRTRPSILFIDVDCVPNVVLLLKQIRAMPTMLKVKIALFSQTGDRDQIIAAKKAGAHAYILRGHMTPAEIVENVHMLFES